MSSEPEPEPEPELAALLEERARHLAQPVVMPRPVADVAALLAFDVGRERFLLPVAAVGEVLAGLRPSPLPGAPSWIDGIVGARGRAVPLVRVDTMLGRAAGPSDQEVTAVAVIVLAGRSLALRADRLLGIRSRPEDAPSPLPPGSSLELEAIATGTFDDRVVLDPERLIQAITAAVQGAGAPRPFQQGGD